MQHIPFFVKVKYLMWNLELWVGFIFLAVGSFGAMVLLSELNLYRTLALWGAKGQVEGVVLRTESTNTAINDNLIFRYEYAFSPVETPYKSYEGYAFGYAVHEVGTPVQVKYVPGRPEISLPEGTDMNNGGWTSLFILIFPMMGAFLFFGSIYVRIDDLVLLSRAEFTTANLLEIEKKAANSNSLNFVFEFKDRNGEKHQVNTMASSTEENRLMDEEEEWVAYDPENPKKALMIDSLPGYVRLALSTPDNGL